MTINKELEGILIETAERIVIDYANFSGRESDNRGYFREKVINHLESLLQKQQEEFDKTLNSGKKMYEMGRKEACAVCIEETKGKVLEKAEKMRKPTLTKPAREGMIGTMAINHDYNKALSDLTEVIKKEI